MRHLLDLRVRLQQRRNRVHMADAQHYETELQLFLQFLENNTYLHALICTLETSEDVDFVQWSSNRESRKVTFPPSESTRATLCLGILRECAYDPNERKAFEWGVRFSHEGYINEIINDLNEAVLDPLVNYLDDRIDDTGSVFVFAVAFQTESRIVQKAGTSPTVPERHQIRRSKP